MLEVKAVAAIDDRQAAQQNMQQLLHQHSERHPALIAAAASAAGWSENNGWSSASTASSTASGSIWDQGAAILRWFALGYGAYLTGTLLPTYVAHGQNPARHHAPAVGVRRRRRHAVRRAHHPRNALEPALYAAAG